ncbi:MAG: cupin domain-containing protein [Deltaproteobacteria bacterium]|nr:cupin domain-containing protein [Deltaproteobacteria bacterium]
MTPIPEPIVALVATAAARRPLGADAPTHAFTHRPGAAATPHYHNTNERLGIDFGVTKLAFPDMQTMDPRVVRIAPGKCNEYHKHAHESLFVVLDGEGEVLVGTAWNKVKKGDIAFVPRWIFHQSRNTSASDELVILAVTDFGFTRAVLGDYDKRTRLAADGEDVRLSATPA